MSSVDLGNPNASAGSINIKNIIGNGMTPYIQSSSAEDIHCYERIDLQRETTHTMTINAVDGNRVMLTGININYSAGLQKLMVDGVDMIADITGTNDAYQMDDGTAGWAAYYALTRLMSDRIIVGKTIVLHFINSETSYNATLCISWADVE